MKFCSDGKMRKSMKVWMIICLVLAGIYCLIGCTTDSSMISMTVFMCIMAVMFFILGKSPKGNKYLLGQNKGIKKGLFVLISVVAAFAAFGVLMDQMEPITTDQATLLSESAMIEQSVSSDWHTVAPTPIIEETNMQDKNDAPIAEPTVLYTELKKGDKGADVIALQTRLAELGYLTGAIDGDYGNQTYAAVAAFQEENGLGVTGFMQQVDFDVLYADSAVPKPTPSPEAMMQVVRYANISANELVSIMGEPDSVEKGICTGSFDIPCIYYDYDNACGLGVVSFALVNDKVVRFTAYNDFEFAGKADALNGLGVTVGEDCVVTDTGVALRYRCPSDSIDDIWFSNIDSTNNTYEMLQVTYQMCFYEEYYLPISSELEVSLKTQTEMAIRSLLKSPKSADFPWYDWKYGRGLFYSVVQSYVDAENAFGAELRSDFTVVYSNVTAEIILIHFDGEVVYDNGYVPVDELLLQLAGQ